MLICDTYGLGRSSISSDSRSSTRPLRCGLGICLVFWDCRARTLWVLPGLCKSSRFQKTSTSGLGSWLWVSTSLYSVSLGFLPGSCGLNIFGVGYGVLRGVLWGFHNHRTRFKGSWFKPKGLGCWALRLHSWLGISKLDDNISTIPQLPPPVRH